MLSTNNIIQETRSIWNRRNIHDWLSSYLNNRSQFVHYKDYNSEKKHITHGVSQGSIQGDMLFIININNFSSCSDLL